MRRRILGAATVEFSSAGYVGANLRRIAEEAGCNRSLVYFYFGSKSQLFQAVMGAAAEYRERQMKDQPSTLKDGLIYWFKRNSAEPERIRLVMQEALAPAEAIRPPEQRRAYLDEQLAVVKAFQANGLLTTNLDARHLLTAFLALTSFPAAFPNVASVALAADSDSDVVEIWSGFLALLAELLSGQRNG
jgi:AcrR family transcriptional regulator